MPGGSARALDIVQALMDQISPCVIGSKLDDLERYYCLPYRRRFLNLDVLIETAEEMRHDIDTFGRALRAIGATHLICVATRAERISVDYISGRFTAHVLRDAQAIVPSYDCQITLHRKDDGLWRVQDVLHNAYVSGYPIDLLQVPQAPPDLSDLAADDARRLAMDALSIYQDYLDRTATFVANDQFALYADLMAFPYTAHGSSLTQVIEGPEDLRSFYNVLRRCHNGEAADGILRVAERAEFLGADLICGYHTATVFKGGEQVFEPVRSRMLLVRHRADWRLKSVTNSINKAEFPFEMWEPGGTLRTELQVKSDAKST